MTDDPSHQQIEENSQSGEDLNEQLIVTIGQTMHSQDIVKILDEKNGFRHLNPVTQLEEMDSVLQVAEKNNSNFVLLPEFHLPRRYVGSYIKVRAQKYKCIIMGGLEHGYDISSYPKKKRLVNEAFIAIPHNLLSGENSSSFGGATVIRVPKLHPAPFEKDLLNRKGYQFVGGNRLYIFDSTKLGAFAILVCFDFLNLPVQAILQGQIQTLFVLTYNTDIAGFMSIADTMQRLLLCNIVVCNTGYYGGSVAYTPLRDRNKREVMQLKGNMIEAAVTIKLQLRELREAQQREEYKHGEKKIDPKQKPQYERVYLHRPPDYGKLTKDGGVIYPSHSFI